jgi:hypothetical protein
MMLNFLTDLNNLDNDMCHRFSLPNEVEHLSSLAIPITSSSHPHTRSGPTLEK